MNLFPTPRTTVACGLSGYRDCACGNHAFRWPTPPEGNVTQENHRQRNQRERIRARLREIKPEDHDMIELLAVLKGIMDIVDDLAAREHRA